MEVADDVAAVAAEPSKSAVLAEEAEEAEVSEEEVVTEVGWSASV
ncbi:hypothetical protein BIFGAL_03532 [Bifidobacterium gallicum DSM 20093 = LMG 11596]|uniref:Uncharacterized protein n=1 Tax=Bifidobacterium gallicum DSM 20093 = LMG 11596 TaxID=561180 RepID=D1NUK7_9BIFI|nr:hypothetical protein BIFGAL_03532 [Bifidobacterium gallicum DSM 20093 = LMG 11596]